VKQQQQQQNDMKGILYWAGLLWQAYCGIRTQQQQKQQQHAMGST
jgi:hypothetical protein